MKRIGWVVTTGFAALMAGASILFRPAPKLVWNASASVPVGLYAIHPIDVIRSGELVLVLPPEAVAQYLDQRGYLPRGVPILKHVLALPGQSVCRIERTITVDGTAVGDALDRDRQGRDLPAWHGCRIVAHGEMFLMNWRSDSSFDGRYFGPLPASTIVGRATPLWTKKDN
jgi:conjugative transfer signal peptidase TraF